MTTVFVTGARGKTGSRVVRRLGARAGVEVRGGSSRPHAGDPSSVRFDWHDPSTWSKAVAGVDAIYLMRPDLPDAPQLVAGLVDQAAAAHVVLLSEQGADRLPSDDWVRRVEAAVTSRAGTWTLLRPSWFHQVLTDPRFYRDAIRSARVLSLPSGGAPLAWIDAGDIAAVAVESLLDPERHHGQAYTLTGPEDVTVAAVAEVLSDELGTRVRVEDPPIEEAVAGFDPWATEVVGGVYRRVHTGDYAGVTDTVEEVTGGRPVSITDFIRSHRDEWID